MSISLSNKLRAWLFPAPKPAIEPLHEAIRSAQTLLLRAAAAGRPVPDSVMEPILKARHLGASTAPSQAAEQSFYTAYRELAALTADISKRPRRHVEYPFEEAVEDSELLLKFASESGMDVPGDTTKAVLGARTALKANALTDDIRGQFYAGYSKLSKLFGDVTAETIRSCTSQSTRRRLARDRLTALAITLCVALISVVTFVSDSTSRQILGDVAANNALAVKLSAALTPTENSPAPSKNYADNPCNYLTEDPQTPALVVRTAASIEDLQQFAAVIRELRGRAIKLNNMLSFPFTNTLECDPFLDKEIRGCPPSPTSEQTHKQLQLNPAVKNYTAEVLCKISAWQRVRTFANNVQYDYAAVVGAVTSYALPILYALLGAYAFRLRLFGETLRKRTFHPSYADSARMITAVIAGAISGLFNPAQGLSLSPLAVAFLVGYGVELFFKLLDTLTNAFGSPGITTSKLTK